MLVPSQRGAEIRVKTWQLYLPLFLWLVFSSITIWCYAGGPYLYKHTNSLILYVYLGAVHLAIVTGYLASAKRFSKHFAGSGISPKTIVSMVEPLSLFALLGAAIAVYANVTSGLTLDAALNDPAEVRAKWIESGGSYSMHAIVTLSIVNYPLLMTVFGYWNHVRPTLRLPAIVLCIVVTLISIQGGSRAGIFGMLVVVGAAATAASIAHRAPWSLRQILLGALAAAAAFGLYSSFIILNRSERPIVDYVDFIREQRDFPVDPNHFSLDLAPNVIAPALVAGFFYFGHAYEGLAIALEKPYVGTSMGFGHSAVLVRSAESWFGLKISRTSYFYRLVDDGDTTASLWITIYPWIASDLTFPGSVLFMALFGWWCATAWADFLRGRSVYAAWAFGWIAVTIAATSGTFPPGDYGALISYWGSIALWLATRRRAQWKSQRLLSAAIGSG